MPFNPKHLTYEEVKAARAVLIRCRDTFLHPECFDADATIVLSHAIQVLYKLCQTDEQFKEADFRVTG